MISKQLDVDRTWIGCVLFADIGGYSAQPVQQQMEWKTRFNSFLSDALEGVDPDERHVLDTGDGAAVCFLGPPEPAMHAALKLRKAVMEYSDTHSGGMRLRIGINLGPLRLMKDVNDRINAVGDAINVSQRVMNFAALDQILVSRSFYETVNRLSGDISRMFTPAGTRTDKNGREHVLYDLGGGTVVSQTLAEAGALQQSRQTVRDILSPLLGPIAERVIIAEAAQSANMAELFPRLLSHLPDDPSRKSFTTEWEKRFPAAEPPGPPQEVGTSAPVQKDAEFYALATLELAQFIGPVAKIVVAEAAKRYASMGAVLDALTEEIPSVKDRERFRKSLLGFTLPDAKPTK